MFLPKFSYETIVSVQPVLLGEGSYQKFNSLSLLVHETVILCVFTAASDSSSCAKHLVVMFL